MVQQRAGRCTAATHQTTSTEEVRLTKTPLAVLRLLAIDALTGVLSLGLDHPRINLHHFFIATQPDLAVLNRTLQLHRTLCQLAQGQAGIDINIDDAQILGALNAAAGLPPPDTAGAAITINNHMRSTTAGLENTLVIRLTDFNPEIDGAGQVFLPNIRF